MPIQNLVNLIFKNLVEDQKCEDNGDDALKENADIKKVINAYSIQGWSTNSIASYFKMTKADLYEIINPFQNMIAEK